MNTSDEMKKKIEDQQAELEALKKQLAAVQNSFNQSQPAPISGSLAEMQRIAGTELAYLLRTMTVLKPNWTEKCLHGEACKQAQWYVQVLQAEQILKQVVAALEAVGKLNNETFLSLESISALKGFAMIEVIALELNFNVELELNFNVAGPLTYGITCIPERIQELKEEFKKIIDLEISRDSKRYNEIRKVESKLETAYYYSKYQHDIKAREAERLQVMRDAEMREKQKKEKELARAQARAAHAKAKAEQRAQQERELKAKADEEQTAVSGCCVVS